MMGEQLSGKELEIYVEMIRTAERPEAISLLKKIFPKISKNNIELILRLGELRGVKEVMEKLNIHPLQE